MTIRVGANSAAGRDRRAFGILDALIECSSCPLGGQRDLFRCRNIDRPRVIQVEVRWFLLQHARIGEPCVFIASRKACYR